MLLAATALTACGESGPSRAETVAAFSTEVVPARFAALAESAGELNEAVDTWCETGDAGDLTEAVSVVRSGWNGLAPFWFGPVMERRSRPIIDPSVRPTEVDELLASVEPLTATSLRELYGADQRGLGVLDVLAERPEVDDRTCEYGRAAGELVAEETSALAADWTGYGPTIGQDDAAANDALEAMVNESLFALARVSGGNDTSPAATLDGVAEGILGADGTSGITALLNDDVVEQLLTDVDAARSLEPSAVMRLEATITTNIVSSLGLSVQFSDADGDG